MVEHPKSKSTGGFYRADGSPCTYVSPSLFDEARYLLLDVGGEKVAGVSVHGTAAGVHQELLKVPRHIGPVMYGASVRSISYWGMF